MRHGEMTVHGYEDGSGFNATIPGTALWRSRYPMNAFELRKYVQRQAPDLIKFSGDFRAAEEALKRYSENEAEDDIIAAAVANARN